MKKFKHFAYVGAIALMGMVVFSACSSSDETVIKPTPPHEGESVNTQFSFSLPEYIQTRMGSTTVQEKEFRGIDNIKLVPYSLGTAAGIGVTNGSTANADLFCPVSFHRL